MLPFLALLLLAIPLAAHAGAPTQTRIHHCVGADGTPIFTDQPCSSMDAVPTSPPSKAGAPTGSLRPRAPTGPRACPSDRAELAQRVAAAFRAGDANALAGLMLWRQYGERGAVHVMRHLASLMQWPFLGIAEATPAPAPAPARSTMMAGLPPLLPAAPATIHRAPPTNVVTVQLERPEGPVSFTITALAGCLWLQP